ncbi:MAG: Maf family protein [Candidatus Sumerlaeaceae bacterium]
MSPESPIVLASASPRRRQILEMLRIPFRVEAADVDERAIEYRLPRELAIKAAFLKAVEVASRQTAGTIVVAADTIVVLENTVYGKPETVSQAREFLAQLAGRAHTVITGIAVQEAARSSLLDAVESRVFIQPLTPEQIADYVATGEPMDKAGAYAAQGEGRKLIQRIDGDFFNVVGLPAARFLEMLSSYMEVAEYRGTLKKLSPEAFDAFADRRDK